jgi:hypothetical protein
LGLRGRGAQAAVIAFRWRFRARAAGSVRHVQVDGWPRRRHTRADHVIPPVPMRQWVISVPKRLRGILADRPQAVTTLSRIFLEEIERLLCHAADLPTARDAAGQARPRLGAVSFQHRFGSAVNQHVHLHACVTDGVFKQRAAGGGVTFHAARPLTASDLAAVTQRVRLRLVRWFRRKGFLSREAAAHMLIWQHSGFSVDASVRISLADRDVPGYFQSLEDRAGNGTFASIASVRRGPAALRSRLRRASEVPHEPQQTEKPQLKSRLPGRILPAAQTACDSPSVRERDCASRSNRTCRQRR